MITLRHLRYFEALSRHRHFSRAAEECAVTQPALSVQIQELETSLGIPLIERRRGQVELTRTGVDIARRAADILLSVQDLRDYAISAKGALQGPIALGIIPTIAPYLLAQLLPSMRAAFPKLELTVFEAQTEKLLDEIAMGNLDAALLATPADLAGLKQIELFDDCFVMAACHGSELAQQAVVNADKLNDVDLLLLDEGHCLRDHALSFCRMMPKRMRDKYGAASLSTIMQLIANGHGATFLPEIAVPVEIRGDERIALRRFAGPQPKRTISLAWRNTSPRGDDYRSLAAVITDVGQEIVGQARDILPLPVKMLSGTAG